MLIWQSPNASLYIPESAKEAADTLSNQSFAVRHQPAYKPLLHSVHPFHHKKLWYVAVRPPFQMPMSLLSQHLESLTSSANRASPCTRPTPLSSPSTATPAASSRLSSSATRRHSRAVAAMAGQSRSPRSLTITVAHFAVSIRKTTTVEPRYRHTICARVFCANITGCVYEQYLLFISEIWNCVG